MIKEKRLRDPIFRADILISFGDMKDLESWYEKHDIDIDTNKRRKWAAFTEIIETEEELELHHIHFDAYGFTTIVHETNHCVFNILSSRGMNLSEETKETFAYYQDWLAGQCRDVLEVWTKTVDKKKK